MPPEHIHKEDYFEGLIIVVIVTYQRKREIPSISLNGISYSLNNRVEGKVINSRPMDACIDSITNYTL